MRAMVVGSSGLWVSVLLLAGAAQAKVEIDFVPVSAEHESAAQVYEWIWTQYGERIVTALERRTCLPFSEPRVAALVEEAVSHSGGPEHPMRLRASYFHNGKRSTLVHELGHRHLWQLSERLEEVDGHMTLYLVLDRVWADVWGEEFAEDRIRFESGWRGTSYDYQTAWVWARSLTPQERSELWNELLAMNGFPAGCRGLLDVTAPTERRMPAAAGNRVPGNAPTGF